MSNCARRIRDEYPPLTDSCRDNDRQPEAVQVLPSVLVCKMDHARGLLPV
jgi:hypothetical protein